MDPLTFKLNTLPILLQQLEEQRVCPISFEVNETKTNEGEEKQNTVFTNQTDDQLFGLDPFENFDNDFMSTGAENTRLDQLLHLMHTAPPGHELEKPVKLNMQQLQNLGTVSLGWKVLVESSDGDYVGYICWLLDHCNRLGLEEASRPQTGLKRRGAVLLYYRTVHTITLIGKRVNSPRTSQRSNVMEERRGRSLLMKKVVPPHLVEKNRKDMEAMWSDSEEEEPIEKTLPLPPPVARGLRRPNQRKVIDSIGELYFQTIEELSRLSIISLNVMGFKLGRWGDIAWICIATQDCVYLFDVATLGLEGAFQAKTTWRQNQDLELRRQREDKIMRDIDDEIEDILGKKDEVGPEKYPEKIDDVNPEVMEPKSDDLAEKNVKKSESGVMVKPANNTTSDNVATESIDQKPNVVDEVQSLIPDELKRNLFNKPETSNSITETITAENITDTSEAQEPANPDGNKKNLQQTAFSAGNNKVASDLIYDNEVQYSGRRKHFTLADIFSDPNIEKVMYDSRNFTDFLYHNSDVELNGLRDIQATELYLYMLHHQGDCLAFVPALSTLIMNYTCVDRSHLLFERLYLNRQDESVYHERPLPPTTLSRIASSVVFLLELHFAQMSLLKADLRQLTNVYCSSYALRDDITRRRVEQHVVPDCVQRLGRRTVLRTMKTDDRNRRQACGR